jgi:hypothetical protein
LTASNNLLKEAFRFFSSRMPTFAISSFSATAPRILSTC